jgi:predicted RNase H-like HicB family nuclease
MTKSYTIDFEVEDDGRWIAEVPELAGVIAYGNTREESKANVEAIALRVLADQIEHSKLGVDTFSFASRELLAQ